MNRSKIAVLCLLTSVLWQGARAQWIIDGQQVQTLNLNVSDPQALYTDGSREMTAPLAFASSLSPTSGLMRATIPWAGEHSFFIFDDGNEVLKLSDGYIGFQLGSLIMGQYSISQSSEGTAVDFGEHMLSGGWQIDQVLPYDEGIISRGYADTRYVMNGQDSVALGLDTAATGDYSIAAGYKNLASGKYSVAFNGGVDPEEPTEGIYTNVASGIGAAVFGWGNVASGNGAVAFGWESVASGNWSLAAGSSDAIGEFSTALGEVCDASGSDSFAAGYNASATGDKSVAFGHSTTASALGSFANGFLSTASGNYSTAWGSYCDASGQNSIALGTRAKALHPGTVVIADSQNADVTSATNDTFTIRAQNGIYLQADEIHTSGPLAFDTAYTGPLLKAYAVDEGTTIGYFYPRTDENGLRLSGSMSSLLIGDPAEGLNLYMASIRFSGNGARIGFEDRELDGGQWSVTASPTTSGGIVSKGYADGRYLQRTEGITTNHTFQAGDTLVISNGLITAINP